MTLKEQLQMMIDVQKEYQKDRFESMGYKQDEAHRLENLAHECYTRVESIYNEIEQNKNEILKLQAIVDEL